MKFLGVKNEIPKHIRAQAKAAKLGTPDFYVGPTVSKSPSATATLRRRGEDGRDPRIDVEEMRKNVLQAARKRRKERVHRAVRRLTAIPRSVFRRVPRPKTAR